MKSWIKAPVLVGVIMALLSLCHSAFAQDDAESAIVPGWSWVVVENDEPVAQEYRNATIALMKGDTCGIEFGGQISVLSHVDDSLLVEYTAPGDPMGTACPSGIQFTVSAEAFRSMTEEYESTVSAIEVDQQEVSRILADDYYGDPLSVQNWQWVTVVNLDSVTQHYSNGDSSLEYGDTCGIVSGGTVYPRGRTDEKTLYEYIAPGATAGTPCPSHVLFWAN